MGVCVFVSLCVHLCVFVFCAPRSHTLTTLKTFPTPQKTFFLLLIASPSHRRVKTTGGHCALLCVLLCVLLHYCGETVSGGVSGPRRSGSPPASSSRTAANTQRRPARPATHTHTHTHTHTRTRTHTHTFYVLILSTNVTGNILLKIIPSSSIIPYSQSSC